MTCVIFTLMKLTHVHTDWLKVRASKRASTKKYKGNVLTSWQAIAVINNCHFNFAKNKELDHSFSEVTSYGAQISLLELK